MADIAVTGYTVPYDGLPHTASGTATGALGEDLAGLLDLSATTHTAAGSYPADAWTFHDPAGNYADATGTVADAITPATLTVTADDQTRPYGTPNPVLEATISGFVAGETLATTRRDRQPRLLHDRDGLQPGRRQPVPDHLQRGHPGLDQLHVRVRRRRADRDQREPRDHGRRPVQALRHPRHLRGHRVHGHGLQGADSVDAVTLTSPGAPATAGVAGSPYPIEVSAATGSGLANYTVSYVPGELTVTAAGLTVIADDQVHRPYDGRNPASGHRSPGFWARPWPPRRDRQPRLHHDRAASSPVDALALPGHLRAGTLASANYTFAYVAATRSTAGSLVITADDRSKPYGTLVTFAGTEFTVTGLRAPATASTR